MLVLTRKTNEAICIGDNIEIVVLEAHGSRVRLGFRAPPHISIQRREVAERTAKFRNSHEFEGEFELVGAASEERH